MTDSTPNRRYAGEEEGEDRLPEHELDAEPRGGGGIMGSGGTATDTGTGSVADQAQLGSDDVVAPSDEHGLVDVPGDDLTDGLAGR